VLAAKTRDVQCLQYDVLRASKSYNDSLRTYTEKLARIGIPRGEVEALGFAPMSTLTSVGPAGLVTR
jgi:growth arrest-specific protein 8